MHEYKERDGEEESKPGGNTLAKDIGKVWGAYNYYEKCKFKGERIYRKVKVEKRSLKRF